MERWSPHRADGARSDRLGSYLAGFHSRSDRKRNDRRLCQRVDRHVTRLGRFTRFNHFTLSARRAQKEEAEQDGREQLRLRAPKSGRSTLILTLLAECLTVGVRHTE